MAVDAMTDSTVIEEQSHDVATAPVAEPDSTPPAEQSIDDLLAEYDRATAQPEPEPATIDNVGQDGHEIDALLAEFGAPSAERQRITELSGQVDALNAEK